MSEMDCRVKLGLAAIRAYVTRREVLSVPPDTPEELLRDRAGVFVCLKEDGQLRGCIGTIEPSRPSIAEEIIANAISAAVRDPRFTPVREDELDDLACSVDVLAQAQECALEGLDPRRYGVIVESGPRRGLLLPDLEGVDTVEDQVSIARRKAGIDPHEPVKLYRFEVIRYE